MPITYRTHYDARDGQEYQCVLMPDGKWWSARNLAWDGAGVAYGNDPENSLVYGKLYNWDEALASCPPGSHLPNDAEWTALSISIPDPDAPKLESTAGWEPSYNGTDDYGFRAIPGGYFDGVFRYIGYKAFWWIATEYEYDNAYAWHSGIYHDSDTTLNRNLGSKSDKLSVRFVVDKFVPPPPKLFGAPFHGFERGLSCKLKRQIIVDDSMGGPVTLIPVAPESYDEWEIEAELWVPASYAQQIEAKVPPRGTPTEQAIRLPPRGGEASFPGLLPHESTADYDLYSTPQVTALESLGRKGPRLDLIGYRITFILRDGYSTGSKYVGNFSTTPTTTAPAWLSGKFTAHQIQDWSNQDAVSNNSRPYTNFNPIKHGRRWDVNFNLDHLSTDRANEVVSLFRGVRHNPVTITMDRGPEGLVPTSVYLTELDLQRGAGLWWDGTLTAVLA